MIPKSCLKKCSLICSSIAALLVLGTALICFRILIYKSIISEVLTLKPDSFTYQIWQKNPVPLTLKLYLFNWTNAVDFKNSTVKPNFEEIGPYVFDETKEKVNITWNENNNTISFYHLKKWWFNAEKSAGTLDDTIVSVNPIALSSSVAVKNWNFILKEGLNVVLRSVEAAVYSSHTAGEVLFNGYNDTLLTMAAALPSFATTNMPNYDKFGWFYTRNNSETFEGHFNMDTGLSGQFGQLNTWKFANRTPYFAGKCGNVGGSAGEFFPANLTKESLIKFFSPDLCRFAELEFGTEIVVGGIEGYKYEAGDRFLDNGTKIKDNKCFCVGDCMPYGALNISACRYGSPAFISLPHFYKADPFYTEKIEGMHPEKRKHEFFMVFEPITGIPLQVSARLQVNLLLQPIPGIKLFEDAPEIYVPILWFEQSIVISEEIIFYLSLLNNLEFICLITGIICILSALILTGCYCYLICNTKFVKSKKRSLDVNKTELPLTRKEEMRQQQKLINN